MEKVKQDLIIDRKFYCINNQEVKYFCCNIDCTYSALSCGNLKCECILNKHEDCQTIGSSRFIDKIIQKKQFLSKDIQQVFKTINNIYLQIIQKISQERQKLNLLKQNYGLNLKQAQLFEMIKNKQWNAITGSIINQVRNNIKIKGLISSLKTTPEKIKEYWSQKQKELDATVNKIRQIFTDVDKFKQMIYYWPESVVKKGFKLQQNKITKQYMTQKQNIVFLYPFITYEKKTLWGFKLNFKQNQTFTIGISDMSILQNQDYDDYRSRKKCVHYQISSNGFLSQKPNFQMRKRCFNFLNGDTIYFKFDPFKKEFKINKNNDEGFYVFKNIETKQAMRIFITRLNIQSTIQLIENIPEIDWNKQINIQRLDQNKNNINQIDNRFERNPFGLTMEQVD